MTTDKKDFHKFIPYILIVLYSAIMAFSAFMNGDDYLWYLSFDNSELSMWQTANGRLFSNQVTLWLARSIIFRFIFMTVFLSGMLILLGKLFDLENKIGRIKFYLPVFLFILIPPATYAETVNWISGFTNYIFSFVPMFIFMLFMFRCIFSDHKPKPYTAVIFFILALMDGLCVEHITIYNIILAAAILVLVLKMKKKGVPHAVAFLIGAVIAGIMMFSNNSYQEIYADGDSVGNRYFELGLANIMQNAFSFVVMHYAKDFWIVSIVLTLAFSVLYFRTDYGEKKPKYLSLCMTICWVFSVYSVFTMCIADFRVNTPAMKIVALETAFAFLYFVSIAYLIYVFLGKGGRIRAYIYLISTLILTAPFLVVSPATARCYLANYVFWILLCGEIASKAIEALGQEFAEKLRKMVFTFAAAAASIISFMCFSNKYYNDLRFDYIKEQLQDKRSKNLNIILLPYSEYTHDDLEDGLFKNKSDTEDEEFSYNQGMFSYYGIDYDEVCERVIIKYSPNDYNIEKSSEY